MKFYPSKAVPEDALVELINYAFEKLGGYDVLEYGNDGSDGGDGWYRMPYDFYVGSFIPSDAKKVDLERLARALGVLRHGQLIVPSVRHRKSLVTIKPYAKLSRGQHAITNLDFEVVT